MLGRMNEIFYFFKFQEFINEFSKICFPLEKNGISNPLEI